MNPYETPVVAGQNPDDLTNDYYSPGLRANRRAADMYGQAANGLGPSMAAVQYQRDGAQAQRATLQAMLAARGGNVAAQQSYAMGQGGNLQTAALQQAALQRQMEMAQAQAAYAGLGGQMVGTGLGYAQLGQQNAQSIGQNVLDFYAAKKEMDQNESLANKQLKIGLAQAGIGALGSALGGVSSLME